MEPPVAGRGWSPMSSKKPVVTAVELRVSTIGPHCSRGVQPGGICAYAVQREPRPGGPGPGWRPGWKSLCRLAA